MDLAAPPPDALLSPGVLRAAEPTDVGRRQGQVAQLSRILRGGELALAERGVRDPLQEDQPGGVCGRQAVPTQLRDSQGAGPAPAGRGTGCLSAFSGRSPGVRSWRWTRRGGDPAREGAVFEFGRFGGSSNQPGPARPRASVARGDWREEGSAGRASWRAQGGGPVCGIGRGRVASVSIGGAHTPGGLGGALGGGSWHLTAGSSYGPELGAGHGVEVAGLSALWRLPGPSQHPAGHPKSSLRESRWLRQGTGELRLRGTPD